MTTHKNRASRKGLTRRELLRHGIHGGLAAGLLGGLWLSGCRKISHGDRPNVIVTLIDTLRPDYLGFNGYRKKTAKFLAKLSKKSVVFERAFAPSSWTAPSTASLFTSRYPHRHGVINGFFAHKLYIEQLREKGKAEIPLNRIPEEMPTLPEIFRSMGYETFGMSANINIGGEIGFDRGFDLFEMMNQAPAEEVYLWVKKCEARIKRARPYFLYLHPNDVHMPYHKREPYYEERGSRREDFRASYVSEIGYVDEYIGKIYKTLKPGDNTIFLVISDHGEEFWEHGDIGHEAKLYRELTHVLMLLHAPFLKLKPGHVNLNVSLVDVVPTLMEMAGREPLKETDGLSLVPLLKDDVSAKRFREQLHNRTVFSHRIENFTAPDEDHWSSENPELQHWAAIYRNWNLIESWGNRRELYDHNTDVMEQQNVFSKHPEFTSRLLAELHRFKIQGRRKSTEKGSVDLDEEMLENLKSLGYVDK